jgi:serine/threonine protein phosphatase PrpC
MLELQASPAYSKFAFHERLRLSIELANLYIFQMSAKRPEYNGMGATFTAVGFFGNNAFFGQVGDSRAYLIRRERIQQITRDQSLVGQLVEAGHLTEEEAEHHSYRNVILQALGASQNLNVVIDRLGIRDMDTFALCSDGLSNKVRPDEIKEIIDRSGSLKEACDTLIGLANERGGEDNITVLIARVSGGRLIPPDEERATALLTSDSGQYFVSDSGQQQKWLEKWGAETLPRDPELPYHIQDDLLDDEEEATLPPEDDTIPPTEDLGSKK